MGSTGSRLDPALDEVLTASSRKPLVSDTEGVSPPRRGDPEKVVRDWVGVTMGEPVEESPRR